jgi:hypothetical protein
MLQNFFAFCAETTHAAAALQVAPRAGGAWLINSARNNITDLNRKISSLVERSSDFAKAITKGENTVAGAVADGETKLRGKADSLVGGLIWSDIRPKAGYIRIGNMQICWDSVLVGPEKSPNHHHDFTFPAAFLDEPIVTPGINPQGNGEVYSVYANTLGRDHHKMDIAEARLSNIEHISPFPQKPLVLC